MPRAAQQPHGIQGLFWTSATLLSLGSRTPGGKARERAVRPPETSRHPGTNSLLPRSSRLEPSDTRSLRCLSALAIGFLEHAIASPQVLRRLVVNVEILFLIAGITGVPCQKKKKKKRKRSSGSTSAAQRSKTDWGSPFPTQPPGGLLDRNGRLVHTALCSGKAYSGRPNSSSPSGMHIGHDHMLQ